MFIDFVNFEISYNYDFLSDLYDFSIWVTVKYTCKIFKSIHQPGWKEWFLSSGKSKTKSKQQKIISWKTKVL